MLKIIKLKTFDFASFWVLVPLMPNLYYRQALRSEKMFCNSEQFKIMKNAFFHLKNPFWFKTVWIFALHVFWSCKKMAWLARKFATSQRGKQTVAIHLLPKISVREGNQIIKSGQLIEYNMRKIFLEKSCKLWWQNYSQTLF